MVRQRFGFSEASHGAGKDGKIIHGESTPGNVMLMKVSSESGTEFSKHIKTPAQLDGIETQNPDIVPEDPDTLYAKKIWRKNNN